MCCRGSRAPSMIAPFPLCHSLLQSFGTSASSYLFARRDGQESVSNQESPCPERMLRLKLCSDAFLVSICRVKTLPYMEVFLGVCFCRVRGQRNRQRTEYNNEPLTRFSRIGQTHSCR